MADIYETVKAFNFDLPMTNRRITGLLNAYLPPEKFLFTVEARAAICDLAIACWMEGVIDTDEQIKKINRRTDG